MTKKNFLDDYISGIFNNDNLVSMRDGRQALVFGEYAADNIKKGWEEIV